MFGKSKTSNDLKNTPVVPALVHDIAVIPDLFYGGNDPDIYVEKTSPKNETAVKVEEKKDVKPIVNSQSGEISKVVVPPRVPPKPLPVPESPTAPPEEKVVSNNIQKIETPPRSSKIGFVIILGALLLVSVGVGVWYYVTQYSKSSKQVVVNTPVTTPKPPSIITPPPIAPVVSTSTVSTSTFAEPGIQPSLVQKERSLPPFSLTLPPDSDNDKLSTAEEEVFQVDPEVWDTDKDGYYDGQEVYNLYNPKGLAPMKIIDSGLVQEYVNPQWQYRIYYPTSWQATAIDERSGDDVLFNAITGDYIHVKAYKKESGESFPTWFGRVVGDQIYTDLLPQKNRFSFSYMKRKDGLVSYYETPTEVFIIIYYSHEENKNDFLHVMDMMVQSFRVGKVSTSLPDQVVLPVPGVQATTTSQNIQVLKKSEQTTQSAVTGTLPVFE